MWLQLKRQNKWKTTKNQSVKHWYKIKVVVLHAWCDCLPKPLMSTEAARATTVKGDVTVREAWTEIEFSCENLRVREGIVLLTAFNGDNNDSRRQWGEENRLSVRGEIRNPSSFVSVRRESEFISDFLFSNIIFYCCYY